MGDISERLLYFGRLLPLQVAVEDGGKPVQFGLIAEEVAEVFPELVVYDEEGKPETVSYHLLATLLLNQFQKQHARIVVLEDQSAEFSHLKNWLPWWPRG